MLAISYDARWSGRDCKDLFGGSRPDRRGVEVSRDSLHTTTHTKSIQMTPHRDSAVSTVSQSLLYTANESGKLLALRQLIAQGSLPYPSLIFVQSIERADDLHKQLVLDVEGLRVGVVHGGKSNAARDETVAAFREGRVWVLVVTEVMARGMDFGGVKVVVNYGMFLPVLSLPFLHAEAQGAK